MKPFISRPATAYRPISDDRAPRATVAFWLDDPGVRVMRVRKDIPVVVMKRTDR